MEAIRAVLTTVRIYQPRTHEDVGTYVLFDVPGVNIHESSILLFETFVDNDTAVICNRKITMFDELHQVFSRVSTIFQDRFQTVQEVYEATEVLQLTCCFHLR